MLGLDVELTTLYLRHLHHVSRRPRTPPAISGANLSVILGTMLMPQ